MEKGGDLPAPWTVSRSHSKWTERTGEGECKSDIRVVLHMRLPLPIFPAANVRLTSSCTGLYLGSACNVRYFFHDYDKLQSLTDS